MDPIEFARVMNKQGEPETLLTDVYRPAADGLRHPALMLVHGGGFFRGCTRQQGYIVTLGEYLSREGYVCFAPDYTVYERSIREEPGFSKETYRLKAAGETARELLLCRDFIVAHADEYAVDPDRIGLIGGSAGGMAGHEACKTPGAFRCFVSLWGAPSRTTDAEKYPPTFLVHGTADQLVEPAFSSACYETLQKSGVQTELIILDGAGHTCIDRLPEFGGPMLRFLRKWMA